MREIWFSRMEHTVALLVGASLPLIVAGRAVTQGTLAVALVLSLVLAILRRRSPVASAARPTLVAGVLVALFWLPSVVFSLDSVVSLMTWGRTVAMTCGVLVLWTVLVRNQAAHLLALRVLVLLSAVAVPYAALRASSHYLVAQSLKPAASVLVVLIPVLIWAGARLGGRWRWLAALAILTVPAVIWQTGSKSALAGVLVGAGLGVALLAAARWGVRRAAVISVIVIAAMAGAASRLPAPVPLPGEASFYLPGFVDLHRQLIWRFTFDRLQERPLFGWGINQINMSPGAGENIRSLGQEYVPSHPHNWVIEVASETGMVGLAALLLALGWGLLRFARRWTAMRDGTAFWCGVTLGVFWSAGAFNFSVWATWWQLVFMLAMAMMTSAWSEKSGRD